MSTFESIEAAAAETPSQPSSLDKVSAGTYAEGAMGPQKPDLPATATEESMVNEPDSSLAPADDIVRKIPGISSLIDLPCTRCFQMIRIYSSKAAPHS